MSVNNPSGSPISRPDPETVNQMVKSRLGDKVSKPDKTLVHQRVRWILESKGKAATEEVAISWIKEDPVLSQLVDYMKAKMAILYDMADQAEAKEDVKGQSYYTMLAGHVESSKITPILSQLVFGDRVMGNFRNIVSKLTLSEDSDIKRTMELKSQLMKEVDMDKLGINPSLDKTEVEVLLATMAQKIDRATNEIKDHVSSVHDTLGLPQPDNISTGLMAIKSHADKILEEVNELGAAIEEGENKGKDKEYLLDSYQKLKQEYIYSISAFKKGYNSLLNLRSLSKEFRAIQYELSNTVRVTDNYHPMDRDVGICYGITLDVTLKLLQGGSPEEIVDSYQRGANAAAGANQALYMMLKLPSVTSKTLTHQFTVKLPEDQYDRSTIKELVKHLEDKASDEASMGELTTIAGAFINDKVKDNSNEYNGSTQDRDIEWAIGCYLIKAEHLKSPNTPLDQIIKRLPIDDTLKKRLLHYNEVTPRKQMKEIMASFRGLEEVEVSEEMQAAEIEKNDEAFYAAIPTLTTGTYQISFECNGENSHTVSFHIPPRDGESASSEVYIIDPNGYPLKCKDLEEAKSVVKKIVGLYNTRGEATDNHKLQIIKYTLASQKPQGLEKPSNEAVQKAILGVLEKKGKKAESREQAIEWIREDPTLKKLDDYCQAKIANLRILGQRALEEGNLEGYSLYEGLETQTQYSKYEAMIAQLMFSEKMIGNFRNIASKQVFAEKQDLEEARVLIEEVGLRRYEIAADLFPDQAEAIKKVDIEFSGLKREIQKIDNKILELLEISESHSSESLLSVIKGKIINNQNTLKMLSDLIQKADDSDPEKTKLIKEFNELKSNNQKAIILINQRNGYQKKLNDILENMKIITKTSNEPNFRSTEGICMGISIDIIQKLLSGGDILSIVQSYEKGACAGAAAYQSLFEHFTLSIPQDINILNGYLTRNLPEGDYDQKACFEVLSKLGEAPKEVSSEADLKSQVQQIYDEAVSDDSLTRENDIDWVVACVLLQKSLKNNPQLNLLPNLQNSVASLNVDESLKNKLHKYIENSFFSLRPLVLARARNLEEGTLSTTMQKALLSGNDNTCIDAMPTLEKGAYSVRIARSETKGHIVTVYKPSDNNDEPMYIIDPNGFPLKCDNMSDAQATFKKLIMHYHDDESGLAPDDHRLSFTKYELAEAEKN